jgi:hypothetical protein
MNKDLIFLNILRSQIKAYAILFNHTKPDKMDPINPGSSLHLLSINIYIFNSDPNETVREFAAQMLGELKAMDAVDPLITALRNAVFIILQDKSDIYLEPLKKVLMMRILKQGFIQSRR